MTGVSWLSLLRSLLPLIPAMGVAWAVDRSVGRSRDRPPGFESPGRRAAMGAILVAVFYLGIFLPVAWASQGLDFDPESVNLAELFLLHGVLAAALVGWFVLGYGAPRELLRHCGLAPRRPLGEILNGLAVGPFLWLAVILAMLAVTLLLKAAGFSHWLPQEVSPAVAYMAGLPALVRLGLSLSAGVVEEVFFRGFLQRHLGILASSALFVLAHLSYGQPLMLVGIAMLSLAFALLTWWRRNVLPAVVAHILFDAMQLFFLLPSQLPSPDSPALGIC